MKSVERPDIRREGFEGTLEDRGGEFEKSDATDQRPHGLAVRATELSGVNARPGLVLQQPAGDEVLAPQAVGRARVLGEELSERDRSVQIDQRARRSSASSRRSRSREATGLLGGGGPGPSAGGVSQPCRTASASRASDRRGLREACGGTSSATTRSRSVTRIVSPPDARRTYSESLFFKVFRPTDRTNKR